VGSGGQRAEGLARGAAGPAACGAGPRKASRCSAAQEGNGPTELGRCGAQGRKLSWAGAEERKASGQLGQRGGEAEWAKSKGKKTKRKFISFQFFPKQFKIQFQLNSKSDFKPSNTKYYATA